MTVCVDVCIFAFYDATEKIIIQYLCACCSTLTSFTTAFCNGRLLLLRSTDVLPYGIVLTYY